MILSKEKILNTCDVSKVTALHGISGAYPCDKIIVYIIICAIEYAIHYRLTIEVGHLTEMFWGLERFNSEQDDCLVRSQPWFNSEPPDTEPGENIALL